MTINNLKTHLKLSNVPRDYDHRDIYIYLKGYSDALNIKIVGTAIKCEFNTYKIRIKDGIY